MIVGVCGYGFTGAGGVYSLLKEYEEIDYFKNKAISEFTFPYREDGLMDLEFSLMKCPSKEVRGDVAIARFKRLSSYLAKSMNKNTNGKYTELTNNYLESIVQVQYKGIRSSDYYKSAISRFTLKTGRYVETKIEKVLKRHIKILPECERYISVCPEQFYEKTCYYVRSVIEAGINPNKIALLDQPYPPNNPEIVFHYFDNPYAIVCDRDPRDLYLIAKYLYRVAGQFVPTDNVTDFVRYYRAVRKHSETSDSNRVMRLNFENLIYNYDDTVRTIEKFLGISNHTKPKKFFKPEQSICNTQLKNVFPQEKENICYIEKELAEFLYDFSKYKTTIDRKKMYEIAKL